MWKNSKFSPVIPPEVIACSRWSRLRSVLSTLHSGFSAEKTADVTRSRKKTIILTVFIPKVNFLMEIKIIYSISVSRPSGKIEENFTAAPVRCKKKSAESWPKWFKSKSVFWLVGKPACEGCLGGSRGPARRSGRATLGGPQLGVLVRHLGLRHLAEAAGDGLALVEAGQQVGSSRRRRRRLGRGHRGWRWRGWGRTSLLMSKQK